MVPILANISMKAAPSAGKKEMLTCMRTVSSRMPVGTDRSGAARRRAEGAARQALLGRAARLQRRRDDQRASRWGRSGGEVAASSCVGIRLSRDDSRNQPHHIGSEQIADEGQ